jgi:hypothetical protein
MTNPTAQNAVLFLTIKNVGSVQGHAAVSIYFLVPLYCSV